MSGSFRTPRSPNIIWPSLSSILIHYGRQWPEMLTRPKTFNIHMIHTYNSGSHAYFLTTQGHGGPPRMSDQLNAEANLETTQTGKMIHTIHAPFYSNKVNMKGWLWRPNDLQGACGLKFSWLSFYNWGKTPGETLTRELARPGIELRSAGWEATTLPPCHCGGLKRYK